MTSKLASEYVKCGACGINIPSKDVEIYRERGSCPVGCPFGKEGALESAQVDVSLKSVKGEQKKEQRRWAAITTKDGNVYYHNSSTGEDRWEKPADFDAMDPVHEGGGMMKMGNRQKEMLLYAQNKADAARMGIEYNVPPPKNDMLEALEKHEALLCEDQAGGRRTRCDQVAEYAQSAEAMGLVARACC